MIKKLMLVILLFSSSSVFAYSSSFFSHFTKEEIRDQYNFFLNQIVFRFELGVEHNLFYACNNWRKAVVFADVLNPDTKVDDINLIVLVDILNNHDYSSEVKSAIQNKLSYFQTNCQPHVYPAS